jgi:hypothetical protein
MLRAQCQLDDLVPWSIVRLARVASPVNDNDSNAVSRHERGAAEIIFALHGKRPQLCRRDELLEFDVDSLG